MKIEELDSLLRNKIQFIESDVHESEQAALFDKLNGSYSKKTGLLLWHKVLFICIGIAGIAMLALFTTTKNQITTNTNKTNPTLTETPTFTKVENDAKINNTNSTEITASTINYNTSITNTEINSNPKPIKNIVTNAEISETNSNFSNNTNINTALNLASVNYKYNISLEQLPPYFATNNTIKIIPPIAKTTQTNLAKFSSLKPQLSAWVAPTLSNEKTTVNGIDNRKVHESFASIANNSQSKLFTINTGINLQLKPFSFLKLGTGLNYFSSGNSYNYAYKINRIPVIDSATQNILGYITKPDSTSTSVKENGSHSVRYLDIPLNLNFTLLKNKRYTFGIESALSMQLFLKEKGGNVDYATTIFRKNNTSYAKRQLNFQLGFPVVIGPEKKLNYSITPFYGSALGNISNTNTLNKSRNYSGIRFSINYQLFNPNK